jgi:hypothetical protein
MMPSTHGPGQAGMLNLDFTFRLSTSPFRRSTSPFRRSTSPFGSGRGSNLTSTST